jgi:hypothetical protein
MSEVLKQTALWRSETKEQVDVGAAARKPHSNNNGERVLNTYFAVMAIVIWGMIVGLVAYAALYVIPDWQRSNSLQDQQNHQNFQFQSYPSERR